MAADVLAIAANLTPPDNSQSTIRPIPMPSGLATNSKAF